MEKLLRTTEKLIPKKLYELGQPIYHYSMAFLSALRYNFPSRNITIVAVTGTKGKSTTTEIINAILEEAGVVTALSNTIRFKIAKESTDNKYKMSMPGRFFMQRFLSQAVRAGCQYAVIEMTSEGAKFYRHKFIHLDALVFTNLSPEHIESHGSYENYVDAKLSIGRQLVKSDKQRKVLIVNADEKESARFTALPIEEQYTYAKFEVEPVTLTGNGATFTYKRATIHSPLSGLFNVYNMLGALRFAETQGVTLDIIKKALEKFNGVRGRVERIKIEGQQPDGSPKQDFDVIVDYAHTVDSLTKVYEVFQNAKKICVLGGTGGGRDKWKRKEMGKVADTFCDEIILTNEDPYDEDPQKIVADIGYGITEGGYKVVMDRREAIREAISKASTGDVVLITGKGTDPYIMGPNDTRIPWDDASVAREELQKRFAQ